MQGLTLPSVGLNHNQLPICHLKVNIDDHLYSTPSTTRCFSAETKKTCYCYVQIVDVWGERTIIWLICFYIKKGLAIFLYFCGRHRCIFCKYPQLFYTEMHKLLIVKQKTCTRLHLSLPTLHISQDKCVVPSSHNSQGKHLKKNKIQDVKQIFVFTSQT